ncbi:uncharacterized protein FOMMEDRAFT_146318 [Fomitiporia mediterranea MF3/22]|uniref:uncharacterized protein n=1 Tax=Fomitiporia mediterranea (strain MF3/22) TaxID=694068 RepID=UPI0004409B16|nr:uncharacterized protein FOMMEDRAFT_146318 [Fomitiporia mediterranea MF3/22]EJD04360.1 hypothetical protein FOMMEDRAFT_146318 [Fomitiporia mediterranea MF3/22]
MPPKGVGTTPAVARPQHARKPSTASPVTEKGKGKDKEKMKKDDKDAMPPPPPPPKAMAILEPEVCALEESLKNITVTTAQVFKFYTDTKRMGIQKHAPHPPRSLTSALEHELGTYDQICDTLDAHLTRAIAVLQRDLTREETRIREEEAEKARAKAAETEAANADIEMATQPETDDKTQHLASAEARPTATRITTRRPSKISLSTLQRNPFPLRLDLSSASLRLGADEGGLDMSALGDLTGLGSLGSMGVTGMTGLASPVTLAPKSARPMAPGEIPPEVLAALASASGMDSQNMPMQNANQHVDIDLTVDDDLQIPTGIDFSSAGSSVDKPIELDLDLNMTDMTKLHSDLFGEQSGNGAQQSGPSDSIDVDELFGPEAPSAPTATDSNDPTSGMDMSILLSEHQAHDDALFASLNAGNHGTGEKNLDAQPRTGPSTSEGGGDGTAFDYSAFFNNNGPPNQDQLDMMEQIFKLGEAGGGHGEASGSGSNNVPPGTT